MTSPKHADPLSGLEPVEKFFEILFWIPALSVIVFLRYRLGYRLMRPLYFISAFAVLIVLAGVGALVNELLARMPGNPLAPQAAVRPQPQTDALERARAAARATEISPNAGKISTPQTDPEAYKGALPGSRWMRHADGTWARMDGIPNGKRLLESLPEKPTIIPPVGGAAAARAADASDSGAAESASPSFLSRIPAVILFAVPMLTLAIFHRWRGWRLIFTHQWHSVSRGLSYVARVLPFLSELTIQRKLEPLLVGLMGVAVLYFSSSLSLGLWLVFAGLTLGLAEELAYEREINELLDRHDARIEARWASEEDAVVKGGGRAPAQASAASTGGVFVTVAPELERLLSQNTQDEVVA